MRCYIIVTSLFIAQHKVVPDKEFAPACCWPALFSGTLWWQIVYGRIRPCISYKVKIFIFVYYGNKILFYIPAVTKNDDVLHFTQCRHNLTHHGCSQFQFGFPFLPHTISKWDAKKVDCVFVPQWDTEHQTYKAVPIEIV